MSLQNDEAGAKIISTGVLAMTRRDTAANIWLTDYYSRRGNVVKSLEHFDYAMRSSQRARDFLIDALLVALQNEDVPPQLAELMREGEPVWEDQFWLSAYRFPASAKGLARLRVERAKAGVQVDPRSDKALLQQLVAAGDFDLALALHRAAFGARSTGIVSNNSFERTPAPSPFDWEVQFEDSILPNVDTANGRLLVAAYSNATGLVAKQLIHLSDEEYELTVEAVQPDLEQMSAYQVRIACAERAFAGAGSKPIRLVDEKTQLSFSKPVSECKYHWLQLEIAKSNSISDADTSFENIAIEPR